MSPLKAQYESLRHREFRVLRFQHTDEKICAVLEVLDLDQASEYLALSYTWQRSGRLTPTPSSLAPCIQIDGTRTSIQDNLHDALSQMFPAILQMQMPVFIDALCIDQQNDAEKSVQVNLMRDIYAHAKAVWAWIGIPASANEAELAMELMQHCQKLDVTSALDKDNLAPDLSGSYRALGYRPNLRYRQWLGFLDMLDRDYFRRTWVLQEVTGPAETTFWYGAHRFSRDHLFRTMQFARSVAPGCSLETPLMLRFGRTNPLGRLNSLTNHRSNPRTRDSTALYRLCLLARHTQCTDSRDKVFALYQMAPDLAGIPAPDYSRPVTDIYRDIAIHYVTQSSVDAPEPLILTMAVHPPSGPVNGLPSWVPDWDASPVDSISMLTGYNANGKVHTPGPLIRGQCLVVWGKVVDNLALRTYPRTSATPLDFFRYQPDSGGFYTHTNQPMAAAFEATMVGNSLREYHEDGSMTITKGARIDWNIYIMPKGWRPYPRVGAKKTAAEVVCANRVYGRTEEHGYMGMFPLASRLGDVIVVLAGAHNPHVLRPTGSAGNYLYIGDCYVHGIMDGEAMGDGTDLKEFVLQ